MQKNTRVLYQFTSIEMISSKDIYCVLTRAIVFSCYILRKDACGFEEIDIWFDSNRTASLCVTNNKLI